VTRSLITAAEWTLGPETAQGAPAGIYSAQCLACGVRARPTDNDPVPVEEWALKHTGLNPTHRQFRATVEGFWRVSPAEGNPYHEGTQGLTQQQRAARMRWRGASFQRIADTCGYACADEARTDFQTFEAARILQRTSVLLGR
jgi:hypothetical protein